MTQNFFFPAFRGAQKIKWDSLICLDIIELLGLQGGQSTLEPACICFELLTRDGDGDVDVGVLKLAEDAYGVLGIEYDEKED